MSTLQAGTILEDRYELQSPGPVHDLGAIYHARDTETGRPVDLLILPPRPPLGEGILAEVMRVQRAVTDLEQRGLAPYERVGRAGGLVYLVRGHVAGYSLARVLAGSGTLKPWTAVEITIQLCESLAAAHRAGLVHGGLAPDSLYLVGGPDGDEAGLSVAVADVGLVPALRPALAAPGRPWGRKPYLSPEQAAGERAGPASDVYVIGSLLYLMLSGRPPFRADDEVVLAVQHLRQEPPALQILAPDLPDPLVQIVQKALAKEPSARYRNAGQLAHILRTQLGRQPEAGPASAPATPERVPPATAQPAAPLGPPVGAMPAPGEQRLVVPPPPRRQPAQREYEFVEDREWIDEPEWIDWRMIILLVVALIAVLGLIPLWQGLYRRYSTLPPRPEPGSLLPLPQKIETEMGDGDGSVLRLAYDDEPGRTWSHRPCRENGFEKVNLPWARKPRPYERWAGRGGVSPPSTAPNFIALTALGRELADRAFFWYNVRSAEVLVYAIWPGNPSRAGSLGVELTGQQAELL